MSKYIVNKKAIFLLLIISVAFIGLLSSNVYAKESVKKEYVFDDSFGKTPELTGYKALGFESGNFPIIGIIMPFLGVIFLMLMMYGGYRWMIAQGNEEEVEKAKKIIIRGIIGLIVVLSAYAFSYFFVDIFVEGNLS